MKFVFVFTFDTLTPTGRVKDRPSKLVTPPVLVIRLVVFITANIYKMRMRQDIREHEQEITF